MIVVQAINDLILKLRMLFSKIISCIINSIDEINDSQIISTHVLYATLLGFEQFASKTTATQLAYLVFNSDQTSVSTKTDGLFDGNPRNLTPFVR